MDRQALPAPDQVQQSSHTYVAPQTPTEELMAGIWARVLNVDKVGAQDNFLALGGHSLLAMTVVARVRDAFQIDLPLRFLFETSNLAQLGSEIDQMKRAEHSLSIPSILPIPRDRELPLSFAQQRLWFLDQLSPGNSFYNVPVAVRLLGRLDVDLLERVLRAMVDRHEVLRTSFQAVDGRPVQVIAPHLPLDLQKEDLSSLPEDEREEQALHLATVEAQRPFDLARGPLFRVTLLRLGEEDHALLFTMHHIISDLWSRTILTQEFAALYTAFVEEKSTPLPELTVQYADYAFWQRQWLSGEVHEAQLSYWKAQLAGSPPVLELPTDRPRPAVQSFNGADEGIALSQELSDALVQLSRREGATLFMTLLAAFQTLLHRYSGQDDLLVGTPVAGRERPEIAGMIGLFLNSLVIRTNFASNPTFQEVLRQVRKTALDAYAHQDIPFEHLVEALQPERSLSHSPLFQVSFSMIRAAEERLELPGMTIQPLQGEGNTAKFDMALLMVESDDGLKAHVEYNTDLFDRSTISRMLQHFAQLLDGIVVDPKQPVSDLPLMRQPEADQLLVEWNDAQTGSSADQNLCALFEEQVERSPNAVAVVLGKQTLTYDELNRRANQLAHYLQAQDVGPETLVGICVERSLETVIGLLGILKAGGAYLPLDPDSPPERLAFLLEDSQAPILLTQERLRERVPVYGGQIICLDADWPAIANQSQDKPSNSILPDNLAYVIYTSGSTGQPKGVLISQGAIANQCMEMQAFYALSSDDRVLQFTSFNFDASLEQIFTTLITGARLVLLDASVWGTTEFYQKLAAYELTAINVPTVYWQQLVQEWVNAPAGTISTGQLRLAIVSGEQISPEAVRLWQQLPTEQIRLLNAYGPTETTITATTFEITPDNIAYGRVPIGRPTPNKELYILDAHGQPTPIGVPGELHIGGIHLAHGYLNRPALSAERFIPNPFSAAPGARLYKTGDLARYLADGQIDFLGRVDYQVKIRGFRVELGEIEAVLEEHPDIRESVVVAREEKSEITRSRISQR